MIILNNGDKQSLLNLLLSIYIVSKNIKIFTSTFIYNTFSILKVKLSSIKPKMYINQH